MNNIFDSPSKMAAMAEIEVYHMLLRELRLELARPLSPVEKALDEATGFDMHRKNQIQHAMADIQIKSDKCKTAIALMK